MRKTRSIFIACLAGSLGLFGCATNSSIDQKIAESQARTDQKIESVEQQVESLQQKQQQTDEQLAKVSREAADALERANQAGVLAKGKVVFEQTLKDNVQFKLESDDVSDEAKAALDEFAARVKALDHPYFIEIQGHTDSTGSTSYNQKLGEKRAEAVRRYLNQSQGIPLLRMSTISYGESLPAADNSTRDGRKENRRVVLVVLE